MHLRFRTVAARDFRHRGRSRQHAPFRPRMPIFRPAPPATPGTDEPVSSPILSESSPTWELELLLSGLVLFALFQLPAFLGGFFDHIEPHATEATFPVVFFVHLYANAIVYVLMAAFVVHLISRAYWVGLVGLHSVYPNGVKWSESGAGPISTQVFRERLVSLPTVIAKTDNFCSVIFSVACLIVIMFLFSVALSGLFVAISYGAVRALGYARGIGSIFYVFAIVLVVVSLGTSLVDKRFGARLAPGSRTYRAVRGLARFTYYAGVLGVTGPIFLTLTTNVGRKKMTALIYVALFGVLVAAAAERLGRSDRLSINSYDYFGASRQHGVVAGFYESQRPKGEIFARTPSVQSDIIRDPYVKLFVPYSPMRDNAAVAKTCPGTRVLQARGLQLGADKPVPDSLAVPALRCLTAIHAVTLNGARLDSIDFQFYQQPETGIRGILAYIPADGLPRGRNVITVTPTPRFGDDAPKTPPPPWVIPFWR